MLWPLKIHAKHTLSESLRFDRLIIILFCKIFVLADGNLEHFQIFFRIQFFKSF